MRYFSRDIKTMDDLIIRTLWDIYEIEQRSLRALPALIDKATTPELKSAFEDHMAKTRIHVRRIERVFEMHCAERKLANVGGNDGVMRNTGEAIKIDDKRVLDAPLIAAAQAVEHYEIAQYRGLISWVEQMGRDDCASVLYENLDDATAADQMLTEIAESNVNVRASLLA